jgi:hypothetical protein
MKASKKTHQCDYPGCTSKQAWRCDVPTSWFRGDDVVLLLCAEHRKTDHHAKALECPRARRQLEDTP